MRQIEHIIEPDKLLLSWQPADRHRLFVAELHRNGDDADLVYLSDSDEFKQAKKKGFDCYPGFNPKQREYTNVLSSFVKRLPPRNRKDFDRFMNALRIKPNAEISDFALLGYSGVKLPDDTFTIIHPFDSAAPPFELMLEVQGYRHYLEEVPYDSLHNDMPAVFAKDPENEYDPQAVKILLNGRRAGYVCRGLVDTLHKWLDRGWRVEATLERINGTPSKPAIFVYVTVNASD